MPDPENFENCLNNVPGEAVTYGEVGLVVGLSGQRELPAFLFAKSRLQIAKELQPGSAFAQGLEHD